MVRHHKHNSRGSRGPEKLSANMRERIRIKRTRIIKVLREIYTGYIYRGKVPTHIVDTTVHVHKIHVYVCEKEREKYSLGLFHLPLRDEQLYIWYT